MHAEVAWVLIFSKTQVQLQIIVDPDYLPDYLVVSYDYEQMDTKTKKKSKKNQHCLLSMLVPQIQSIFTIHQMWIVTSSYKIKQTIITITQISASLNFIYQCQFSFFLDKKEK